MAGFGFITFIIFLIIALMVLASCIKIVPQASALILERLGAYRGTWGVGIHFKVPFIERVAKRVNLKEQVVDFPPQPVITKDNVTMRIDTVVFSRLQTLSSMSTGWIIPLWPLRICRLPLCGILSVIWSWMRLLLPVKSSIQR